MNNNIHANEGLPFYCRRATPSFWQNKLQLYLAMKLFLIFLTLSLQVSAAAYSQAITLSVKKAPFREVMQSIREQTGYAFIIKSGDLKQAKPVTVTINGALLEESLKMIFAEQPFTYQISDKAILIELKSKKKDQSEVRSAPLSIDIRGKVTDSAGKPLVRATVSIKEQRGKITATNENGEFTIKDAPDNGTLIITMVGFETLETKYNRKSDLNIQLRSASSLLDAVQIIGYGSTTKRLSTGNISSVKAETIEQQPVTNPVMAIQGRVPGLQIIQENSTPGASVTVRIRGRNSIGANNNPLYIVDGVPFSSTAIERLGTIPGGSAFGSPLNTISPNDIESIEVLKDADATSIYGSRASNGVVLITTKKGKTGRTKLDIDFNSGLGKVTGIPKPLDLQQYLTLRKDAFHNSGVDPTPTNAPDLLSWDQNKGTNWTDYYLGNTIHRTNGAITLSGGNGQISYLLSGNFYSEGTPQKTDSKYTRSNVHLNLSYESENRKFKLSSSSFFTGDYRKLFGNGALDFINIAFPPNYPAYKDDGSLNYDGSGRNPISDLGTYSKSHTYNLNSSLNLSYSPIPNLIFKANLGYNKLDNDQLSANPKTYVNPLYFTSGFSSFANQYTTSLIAEPQVTYRININRSNIDLLIGSTIQRNLSVGKQLSLSGYTNDDVIESINYGTVSLTNGSTNEYKYLSFFGRLSYNLDNRYILNATVRRDGSTRFGPNKQFGTFGSVGAAWIFSDEKAIKDAVPFLSYGKLRGSWGTTGNDGIGDYGYLSFYNNTNNYGSQLTLVPTTIANSNYGWEVNKKLEIGLDLGFLKDRIVVNTAWYSNRSGNQLVTYPIASTTGFTGYVANLPALVENKGLEFDINTINIKTRKFSWTSAFNLTLPKNKLVSFPGIESTAYASTYVVGQSLGILQNYHFTGIDPQTGIPSVADINKDGNIVPISSYNNQGGDFIIAGSTDPKAFAGLNNSFTFKGFSLDVFLQYVKQDGLNLLQYYYKSGSMNNVWDSYLGYWKQPGDMSSLPKPSINPNLQNYNFSRSDRGVSDASYLRIKNISLSYSLPTEVLKKIKLNNCRIYMQANNVYTFTKYKGYDPETQSSTVGGYSSIPPIRMITLGVNLTF